MNLTILLLSCRRLHYLTRTVEAARRHFVAVEPDIATTWVLFDNGSTQEDRQRLEDMGFDLLLLSRENLGQGPALNHLIATVKTPWFLLLEDDWVVENPREVPFVQEAVSILESDERLGQVKLDAMHLLDFQDRQVYDGPFRAKAGGVRYYVQNPRMPWGGFTCPPAITRTDAVRRAGPFLEDQPFKKWRPESEFSSRTSRLFHTVKSPEMLIFRHIGDEPSPGWTEGAACARSRSS